MRQLALTLSARSAASFDNFVPGRNAELVQVLQALASGRGTERFVYLWGVPGSGRTHLLHAVVHAAAAGGREAHLVAAAAGAPELGAISTSAVVGLARVGQLDGAAQAALFGLYNRIREAAGALVVAGDAPPANLAVRPDLATRLAWGLVYEVHALSDEEKSQAMCARAAERGFELSSEAQAYMLRHGRRDLPSLLDFIDLIDRHSLERKRPVTLPLVWEVMKSIEDGTAGAGD